MKKNWIALLLALCMLITMGTASACCADACCTDMSGMDETQTCLLYTSPSPRDS